LIAGIQVHILIWVGHGDAGRIELLLDRFYDLCLYQCTFLSLHKWPGDQIHTAVCQLLDKDKGGWFQEYPC
jgi:hypothetical protein